MNVYKCEGCGEIFGKEDLSKHGYYEGTKYINVSLDDEKINKSVMKMNARDYCPNCARKIHKFFVALHDNRVSISKKGHLKVRKNNE